MRLLFILTFIAGLLVANPTATPMPAPSIVPINTAKGRHFCTAWSINEARKLWVTAAHCIVAEEAVMPQPFILGSIATPVWLDSLLDLAVVHSAVGAKALHLAHDAPSVGDEVDIIGHPFSFEQVKGGARIVLLHQLVQGEGVKTIFAGLAVGPGNSGGPVLHRGKVISVLQLGWPSGGFLAGTPWDVLVTVLRPFVE